RDRLRPFLDAHELDVEDERALGTVGPAAVGQLLGNPEAALLTDDHELQALRPALDDAAQRQPGRVVAGLRRVEHPSVGGPAGVAHGDGVLLLRALAARPGAEPFAREARGGPLGVGGRRGDVGRGWDRLLLLALVRALGLPRLLAATGGADGGGKEREEEKAHSGGFGAIS